MYAVIFTATTATLDDTYLQTARRMRELAMKEYGCLEFNSVTEGDREISISYWQSREQISAWKSNPEHLRAQELGRSKWYRSYRVEIVEVVQEYTSGD